MFSFTISKTLKKTTSIIFFLLSLTPFLFSQELTQFQQQARFYRNQGLKLQELSDLEGAKVLYQKAAVLDPSYAPVYNDLGIIYEAEGLTNRAQESYLECIKIDPDYLSAYTNLALAYESKRDLKKARFYWEKRANLGLPGNFWTEKARQRLEDISLVLSDELFEEIREQEVFSLIRAVVSEKAALKQDSKLLSQEYFQKAKKSFEKSDYATAIKEALDAQQLNPADKDIEEFIEKVQTKVLSK